MSSRVAARHFQKKLAAKASSSLHSCMKKQLMLGLVLAVFLAFLNPPAFGGTMSLTGKVQAIKGSMITLEVGKDVWDVTLGPTTTVKGEAKVGSTVTVTCNDTDAQKKEIDAPASGG
jgi:hypothetical protein